MGLLMRGEKKVTVFDYEKENRWARDKRVKYVMGDMRDVDAVEMAVNNKQVVYLTAAVIRYMDGLQHELELSYSINVLGTENVVKACVKHKVKCLIQTSTMHVNLPSDFDGKSVLKEDMPYVSKGNSTSHYGTTKALAEMVVRRGNHENGLKTISIRPGGVFGAKDLMIFQNMADHKRYLFMGYDLHLDWVYVDNIAYGHFMAEKYLLGKNDGGFACHITNEEPMFNNKFRRMISYYAPYIQMIHVSHRFFWILAYLVVMVKSVFKQNVPNMGELAYLTPTAMRLLGISVQLCPKRAKKVLGYHPVFTVNDGVQLTVLEYDTGASIFDTDSPSVNGTSIF